MEMNVYIYIYIFFRGIKKNLSNKRFHIQYFGVNRRQSY